MSDHILVCCHCLALNNFLKNEPLKHAKCCECGSLLLPQKPLEADAKLFTYILTHTTLPVVVDFWGSWSGASHNMVDILISLADTFREDALFLRVNSEHEQVLANELKLLDIPTFILFTSGVEYHRIHGAVSEIEFHRWLERYLRIKRDKKLHHPSSI